MAGLYFLNTQGRLDELAAQYSRISLHSQRVYQSTKAVDAAAVLYPVMRPKPGAPPKPKAPRLGVDVEKLCGCSVDGTATRPRSSCPEVYPRRNV